MSRQRPESTRSDARSAQDAQRARRKPQPNAQPASAPRTAATRASRSTRPNAKNANAPQLIQPASTKSATAKNAHNGRGASGKSTPTRTRAASSKQATHATQATKPQIAKATRSATVLAATLAPTVDEERELLPLAPVLTETTETPDTEIVEPVASMNDAATPTTDALDQMPQTPDMPEIPEMPETPDVPEIPEIPDAPDVPEIPEIPETPEQPEIPEIPEIPETPDVPEIPETPEQPAPEEPVVPPGPIEPDEPETPAEPPVEPTEPDTTVVPDERDVSASATAPQLAESAESLPVDSLAGEDAFADTVVAAEITTEPRRMPTLAVMAHARRESQSLADETPIASVATESEESPPLEAVAAMPLVGATLDAASESVRESVREPANATPTRKRPRHIDDRAAASANAQPIADEVGDENQDSQTSKDGKDGKGSAGKQETSVVTRPVGRRFNARKPRVIRTPDFIWENDPRLPSLPWPMRHRGGARPQPLPPASMVAPVVLAHIVIFGFLGLLGALQGLNPDGGATGTWLMAGCLIAGVGGAAAYFINETPRFRRFAPMVLVISQLGLLTWAMLVFGPRASLLALVPAILELALLMRDAMLATAAAFGALLIYALFAGLSVGLALAPVVTLTASGGVVLDVIFVVVGTLISLWLLLTIQSGRERAQAIARARRHEADVLRNLVTQFRQEMQDDTGKLEAALLQALKGHGIDPIPTEGMYRLLAETIMDTASRLEVLQRDREERLRLEGSLNVVIRAVEREWLGVDPRWPDQIGTSVDELVALLRTPHFRATLQQAAESPTAKSRLIPIPSLAIERDTPPPSPISRPLSGESWMASPTRKRRPDLYPLPSTNQARQADQTHQADESSDTDNGHNPADQQSGGPTLWDSDPYWSAQQTED